MMTLEKKHSLAARWNHWINFPLLTLMIWSGLLIYWSNDAYFLPGAWLEAVGMGQRLAEGMSWHFPMAFFFGLNGVFYISYLVYSGEWRYIVPDRSSFRGALLVVLHDLKIYRKPLPMEVKYNGAQRFAYTSILGLGFLSTVTGLAIYKPIQLGWLVASLGGYEAARFQHFLITILFILFFFIHIAQVVRAGWNSFRAMITGWEKRRES